MLYQLSCIGLWVALPYCGQHGARWSVVCVWCASQGGKRIRLVSNNSPHQLSHQ